MLRVTTVANEPGAITVVVEGRLTEETMDELESICAPSGGNGRPARIDVAGLRYSDRAGATALRRLREAGVAVVGASSFLEELMRPAEAAGEGAFLAQLRAGDERAFETLVRRYGARLLATARRIVRNDDEAHDVVQEAYICAFKGIGAFTGEARLSTWLHRIVVNAALMRLRVRSRRPEASIEELLPRFSEDGHFVDSPTAWGAGVEELVGSGETRAVVRACIDRLPDTHRTVILLRDIEGLDTEETARALGVSANAVKVRLHRARQALKTLIEASGLTA